MACCRSTLDFSNDQCNAFGSYWPYNNPYLYIFQHFLEDEDFPLFVDLTNAIIYSIPYDFQ